MKMTMTFAEAAEYQAEFDAVQAGSATPAQAQTVDAVINAISQMMRPLGDRAGKIIDARVNALVAVPDDKQAAFRELLDGRDAPPPRLVIRRLPDGNAEVGTPDEKAAREAELAGSDLMTEGSAKE